mmetsp:Transcript_4446/g.10299  ORF Transcript_4446/g.10299 Transcript_4446/m.10299 type:complete len:216 (-) Transcript_4446:187-834(-)
MGNLAPRLMTSCNPECCAMCFPGDGGAQNEEEGKSNRVFANAVPALTEATEEISIDEGLEHELAAEVELWRIDASNVPFEKGLYAKQDRLATSDDASTSDSGDFCQVPSFSSRADLEAKGLSDLSSRADYDEGKLLPELPVQLEARGYASHPDLAEGKARHHKGSPFREHGGDAYLGIDLDEFTAIPGPLAEAEASASLADETTLPPSMAFPDAA